MDATSLIVAAGSGGLGLISIVLFLIGLGVPLPSELTLFLAGSALRQGVFDLPVLIPVAVAAQVLGLTLAYAIGREGGSRLVLRHGHLVGIGPRQLATTRRYFRRRGAWVVFGALLLPGVRGCVGYAGGVAHVSFRHFVAAAAGGTVIWTLALIGLGYALSNQVPHMIAMLHRFSLILLLLLLVGILWGYRSHGRKRRN